MAMTAKSEAVLAFLSARFPDAQCALHFANPYQCLVAIALSAQTSDKSVNAVTPKLFADFPSPSALALAPVEAIENDIRSLGLFHAKAAHLAQLGRDLQRNHAGEIPLNKDELVALPGIGNKTAGVFLLEIAAIPAIPVDTHVHRIACRLGYAQEKDSPEKAEKVLEKAFPREQWGFLHHALIRFGREICHASKPECARCSLSGHCLYFKKNSSMSGK